MDASYSGLAGWRQVSNGVMFKATFCGGSHVAGLSDFEYRLSIALLVTTNLASASSGAMWSKLSNRGGAGRRVLILGGGVIGTSIAHHLAARGAEVVVLERSGVACAASGKWGGFSDVGLV